MAIKDSITEKYFKLSPEDSDWYINLNRPGSCLTLLGLLEKDPLLLQQMGEGNVTVLDKGVRQGCAQLVQHVLNIFDEKGGSKHAGIGFTREELLRKRNSDGVSAVNVATMTGSVEIVRLLKAVIEKDTGSTISDVTYMRLNASISPDIARMDVGNAVDLYLSAKTLTTPDLSPPRDPITEDSTHSAPQTPIACVEGEVTNVNVANENCTWTDESPYAGSESLDLQLPTGTEDNEHEVVLPTNATDLTSRPRIPRHSVSLPITRTDLASPLPILKHSASLQTTRELDSVPHNQNVWASLPPTNPVGRVCDIIKEILGDDVSFGELTEEDVGILRMMRELCRKHVDFEFVPVVESVFIHYLCSLELLRFDSSVEAASAREKFLAAVVRECKRREAGGELLRTLYNMHDPQGRTPLHTALEVRNWTVLIILLRLVEDEVEDVARDCVNARDAAGRTPLHAAAISDYTFQIDFLLWDKWTEVGARIRPSDSHREDLATLSKWGSLSNDVLHSFRNDDSQQYTALHLAVLHNSTYAFEAIMEHQPNDYLNAPLSLRNFGSIGTSVIHIIHIAAAMGHVHMLTQLLQDDRVIDPGKSKSKYTYTYPLLQDLEPVPALHWAVYFGQAEATRAILNSGLYNQFITTAGDGHTALHFAVRLAKERKECAFLDFGDHLPYEDIDIMKIKGHSVLFNVTSRQAQDMIFPMDTTIKYSGHEKSCINLLLQAGIDIWTMDQKNEAPYPGPMAHSEASQWWYDKVITEVTNVKKSLSDAANATSVVAALVATASFIGPLQPPMGYDQTDFYIHTNYLPIRMYLICNGFSFFFSVASIITAIIPALPMAKESMEDEVIRSQRSIRVASILLLFSIVFILLSFSAASIGVVLPNWNERRMVVIIIVVGGFICLCVLFLYIIRIWRLIGHRNIFVRRLYSKFIKF